MSNAMFNNPLAPTRFLDPEGSLSVTKVVVVIIIIIIIIIIMVHMIPREMKN